MTPRRPRRPQLRTRVLLGVLAVTLVALVAFDVAAVTALHGYLLAQTDGRLQSVQRQYRALEVTARATPANAPAGQLAGRAPASTPATGRFVSRVVIAGPRLMLPRIMGDFYVAFVPGHGLTRMLVQGNPSLVPRLPPGLAGLAAVHGVQTVTSANGRTQLRLQAVPEAGGTLVATTSLASVDSTTGRLALILTIGSAAAGLLVAVGVALVMRRGLRPIETMAAQADQITAGGLTERVSPGDGRSEVGRLGAALNGMLTRIETSIAEREASQELTRRFFADASHELRNPLASLRANAELYQQGALRQRPEVDEAMRRIAAEAQRMSGLVDDMLRLARLDQHPGQRRDRVDLTALVTECAGRARIADPGRTWQARVATGLVTTGDEELLRRAIDNLLANVQAHTPAGTAATITAAGHGGSVTVEVSDDGPGVPAGQLPRIFDRFYRSPAQPHCAGSGLGLAIVTAIAAAHDGSTGAALNDPHGLRITLTLPAAGRPRPAEPVAAAGRVTSRRHALRASAAVANAPVAGEARRGEPPDVRQRPGVVASKGR